MTLKCPGEEVTSKVLLVRFKQMFTVSESLRFLDVKRMSKRQRSVTFLSRI